MDLPTEAGADGKRQFFDRHAGDWNRNNSAGSERLKIAELVRDMGLRSGWTVLEPGCGTGQVSEALLAVLGGAGRLIPLDISREMLKEAMDKTIDRAGVLQADACTLPLAASTVDCVVCFRVFPHLDDKHAALAEFARVLRPGGQLVIAHPAGREYLNFYHARAGGAVARDMLPDELEMRRFLLAAGFSVHSIEDRKGRYLLQAAKSA